MGTFTSSITGLTSDQTYYVRAYATNSEGTGYGDEKTFKTNQEVVPTVTSLANVSDIMETTASFGGEVTSNGYDKVTAKGVCWSTASGPTTADSKTEDGTGEGVFTSAITGLSAGTTYYVRAYATNSKGTEYGSEKTFTTTAGKPTVTTTEVSSITTTTADSGGNVTSDGGDSVTARGVCWSTSSSPTTVDSKTEDGTGEGVFTSAITGLSPSTEYYVRAYATNSKGTAYGEEKTFATEAQSSGSSSGSTVSGNEDNVTTSGTTVNNGDNSQVIVGPTSTIQNNGVLTDLTNSGTVKYGEVSGDSTNTGTLSNVTITDGSTVDNQGGTVSGGSNEGTIYGGTVTGTVTNDGVIYGGSPDGEDGVTDYSVLIDSGATVTGGTVGGEIVNQGELKDVTILADSVIHIETNEDGTSGTLAGTITISGDTGAASIVIPSGVTFPDSSLNITALTPQMLIAYAQQEGWFWEGDFAAADDLPELDDDLLIIAGIVMTSDTAKLTRETSVTLAYDPTYIPEGFTEDDLQMFVYDGESGVWLQVDFEVIETGVIQFSTQYVSAFALVLPTVDTASPILEKQSFFDLEGNRFVITGSELKDVTCAPTLIVPEDRLDETVLLFMGLEFSNGIWWLYGDVSDDPDSYDPAWFRFYGGDPLVAFDKRTLDNPQLNFDAGLADYNLYGEAFYVNVYFGFASDENLTDFQGASFCLVFE